MLIIRIVTWIENIYQGVLSLVTWNDMTVQYARAVEYAECI